MQKSTQNGCPTLCDSMDHSPPSSSVPGILQARILERVAMPFSRGSSLKGTETRSPALQADSLPSEPLGKPRRYIIVSNWPKRTTLKLAIFQKMAKQEIPQGKQADL